MGENMENPSGRVANAASAERLTRSAPAEKISNVKRPVSAVQGSVGRTLKGLSPMKLLQSFAFFKLVKVLRMILRLPAMPLLIAVVVAAWLLRRRRR